jgi:hypothetical protein
VSPPLAPQRGNRRPLSRVPHDVSPGGVPGRPGASSL